MLRGLRQAIEIGRKAFRLGAWRHTVGAHQQQLSTERCAGTLVLSSRYLLYNTVALGRGGLFGNSPDAVNLNGTLLVGKLCKAFKEGKIKSLPAPSSTPGRAPEPAIESPVDQAKHAQQYADCLKLAVDNPSMVCKQEASGASMREPEASTSQPSARGTIGASSDGNLGVRHDASMAEPEASTSQPTAKGTIGASSDGNPRVQHAASMPEPEASTSQPTAHGTIGASCDGNRLVRHDGVTVSQVVTGGPAAQVGIEVGDVILAIDDHYLYTIEELNNAVDRCKPGSTIKIRYRRYSMTYEAFLIVGNREAAKTEH